MNNFTKLGLARLAVLGAALLGTVSVIHKLYETPIQVSTSKRNFNYLPHISFDQIEFILKQFSIDRVYEVAWLSDGSMTIDVGNNKTAALASVEILEDQILDFVRSSPQDTIYFYHRHLGFSPTTYQDLVKQVQFQREASKVGKKFVSRVVNEFGVWETEVSDIPYIPSLGQYFAGGNFSFSSYFSLEQGEIDALSTSEEPLDNRVNNLIGFYSGLGVVANFRRSD
ncbi:hypothetical protein J4216_00340 [Candidatus Woesearchaeota archaeon]|nr:hypothetical protein [Candidatus Woesearchaeota archaeon]